MAPPFRFAVSQWNAVYGGGTSTSLEKGGPEMTDDKIKGKANELTGATRRKAGEMTGNEKMEARGARQEVKGEAQQKLGDVKDKARDLKDKVR